MHPSSRGAYEHKARKQNVELYPVNVRPWFDALEIDSYWQQDYHAAKKKAEHQSYPPLQVLPLAFIDL